MAPKELSSTTISPVDGFTLTIDKSKITRDISHYAAVWLWIGWTFFYPVFFISLPLLYIYCKPLLTAIVALIIISAIMPIKRESQPKFGYAIGDWILKKANEYFKIRMFVENIEEFKKNKQAIIAMEPHDVLPLSIFAFNDILEGLPDTFHCLGCITSVCFSIPLMKHIYTWVNAVSVDKKNLIRMLKNGLTPVLCPGGVQEVTMMKSNKEIVLYLNSRLGFVKLALQHGVPLVPVFTFGLRDSFSFWIPKSKFVTSLGRTIGFLPMMMFGVWGLPLAPSKPCQYNIVVGKPIAVPKIDDPSEEQIKKYHAEYISELSRIYELHKSNFGCGDVSLRIV